MSAVPPTTAAPGLPEAKPPGHRLDLATSIVAGAGMPRSDDAERGLISCLLQNPDELLSDAQASLPPDAFYHAGNRLIYEELLWLHAQTPKRLIDLVTVSEHFMDRGLMDKIGGPATLAELYSFVPTAAHYQQYSAMLRDKMLLRRGIRTCAEQAQALGEYGRDPDGPDVGTLISAAESAFFDIVSAAQNRGGFSKDMLSSSQALRAWSESMENSYRLRGKIRGVPTDLADMDRTLHGIDDESGEIFTISARPGMGKTALACSIVENLGESGIPGAVFSLEMTINQWLNRTALGGAGIDTSKAITGMFSEDEFKRIAKRAGVLSAQPVYYNDASGLTNADLRAKVQILKRKHGIRWIVLDHLHLLQPVTKSGREDDRVKIEQNMQTLQFLKKEFHLAIFLMVQMNRESDRKQGQVPVMADLQGSASIEQFSDHIAFIYRPSYYKPWDKLSDDAQQFWKSSIADKRRANPQCYSRGEKYQNFQQYTPDEAQARQDYEEDAELHFRKNRRGPTPKLHLRYQAEFTRFTGRTPKLYSNREDQRQV